MEQWREIPGYSNYEASNEGRIRKGERLIASYATWAGYLRCSLRKDGKATQFSVHRLVLLAFIGKSALQANHKNGCRSDNRLENLEYVTDSENKQHSVHVLKKPAQQGSKHGCHILTEKEVLEIRALRPQPGEHRIRVNSGGLRQEQIAKQYGVSTSTVSFILRRKTWRHI